MKRYLFIIIQLCISSISLFSQDLEPAQVRFRYNGSTELRLITLDDPYFQNNGFLLGWHWCYGRTISQALQMNQMHTNITISDTNFQLTGYDIGDTLADNMDVVINVPTISSWGWDANWHKFSPTMGISMQWEPALLIDNPPEFQTIEGDTTKPIFGFKTISGDRNGSRLYLDQSIPNNTMVLSDNWPDNEFHYPIKPLTTPDNDSIDINALPNPSIGVSKRDFNGTDLYFTLNLRRESADTVRNVDNVLKIQLKYFTIGGDSGYVRFENLPYSHKDSISILPKNRGKVRKIDNTPHGTTEFNITKSMLPIQSDSGRMDITISAKMIFDGSFDFPDNHNLQFWSGSNDADPQHIKRLKMEITYVDNSLPISIDWIRIESKVAQDLFRGYYDSAIVRNVQKTFEFFDQPRFRQHGIRPFRFYVIDEHLPVHWGTHRYINKLIGNIGVVESVTSPYPLQKMYYLGLEEFWSSFGFVNVSLNPVPYVKYGYNWDARDWDARQGLPQDSIALSSFGFQGGYRGNYFDREYYVDEEGTILPRDAEHIYEGFDYLHSDYETRLDPTLFSQMTDTAQYNEIMKKSIVLQKYIENRLVISANDPINQKFLFQGKPWWAQMWIGNDLRSNIVDDEDTAYVGNTTVLTIGENGCNRPFTGEEIAMQLWEPLILGAKGLIYDLESSILHYPMNTTSRIGIWHGQRFFDNTDDSVPVEHRLTQAQRNYLLSGDTALLYSDLVGGDYITIPTDSNDVPPNVYVWDYTQTQDYLPRYSTMKYILGLDNNLLYLGRKSVRTSVYKINKWVRANEDILMKLRLQSWLGKGYRRWYAQADEIQADTLLKEYILMNSIKTRPINRVDIYNRPYYEQHFRLDSGFYDITLLKDASENAPANVVYLGVQNRRTDPLIYDAVGDTMKFTPTAEFDQHVLSADTAEAHYWQSLWWRRQGAREIRIPINPSFNGYNAREVRVRELNNLSDWFANEPYNNVIDTMLKVEGGEGYIIMKLLPGQGKILRVEPIR